MIDANDADILTDTGTTLDSRIPAALVGGKMDSNVATITNSAITAAAIDTCALDSDAIADSGKTELRSLAAGRADSGTTTTMVDAARSETDTDYWKGCYILFTSGNIAGQCRLITGFTPGTDTVTFAPATTQAVAAQDYEILPATDVWTRAMSDLGGVTTATAAVLDAINWLFELARNKRTTTDSTGSTMFSHDAEVGGSAC